MSEIIKSFNEIAEDDNHPSHLIALDALYEIDRLNKRVAELEPLADFLRVHQ